MARIRGETDDLASLSRLDENILLEELRSRYSKDRIYVSEVARTHLLLRNSSHFMSLS